MEKSEKGNGKRISNNRLGMAAIAIVALLLLGFTVTEGQKVQNSLTYYNAKAATLEEAIEEERTRTAEIDEKKAYMQTDEYVEEIARNRLGLVKDNEIVFEEAD